MARLTKTHSYTFPVIRRVKLDISQPFGPQLARLRIDADIGNPELAERIGWNKGNLSRFESGDKKIGQGLNAAAEYCKAFNVRQIVFDLPKK